jgi:DNA-binding NarL/FixJ family response regulator
VSEAGEAVSEREVEILELVAQGLTNGEIAQRLWVTETTVKFHLSRIYRKLGVSNRTAAALWLRDRGVEDPRSLAESS